MPTTDVSAPNGARLARDQVLDELDEVARLEHSVCVEYLVIDSALGHELEPAGGSASAQRLREAAQAALNLALVGMRTLHRVNRGLAIGGRPPQLGRAASVTSGDGTIALAQLSHEELEGFVARERRIAAAIEQRYTRLRAVVAAPHPSLESSLLDEHAQIVELGADHYGPLLPLAGPIDGVAPAPFVLVSRQEPADALERRLLGLSDRQYALVVTTVETWFAHEDKLGSPFSESGARRDGRPEPNQRPPRRAWSPAHVHAAARGTRGGRVLARRAQSCGPTSTSPLAAIRHVHRACRPCRPPPRRG